jgi:hypothetical protein
MTAAWTSRSTSQASPRCASRAAAVPGTGGGLVLVVSGSVTVDIPLAETAHAVTRLDKKLCDPIRLVPAP